MNCSHFNLSILKPMRATLWLFTVTVALLLATSAQSIALKATSSLSGRVLNIKGDPVPGFRLILAPIPPDSVEDINDPWFQENITFMESRTDDMGRFSVRNIAPVKVRLDSAYKSRTDHESATGHDILSMKVGSVTVYPRHPSAFGGFMFAIKPDTHVENVEIRVRSRQYIRGRIVYPDGTPLVSASIQISAGRRYPDRSGSGSSSSTGETDAEGYFVYQVDRTAFYTVTVDYQEFTATAEPFLLRKGENKEDLVFTLESRPTRPTLADVAAGRVEVPTKSPTSSLPGGMGAWVVNPANGHGYRRIRCGSWDDANSQAAAEDAYLVSITDAAEQEWLLKTFKPQHCWIGLTDYANEGEWVWTSGEPVTYTNWGPHEPQDTDWGDEDFVLIEYSGEWSDAGPESIEWGMMNMAIIEKDSFTGPPSGEK